MTSQDPFRILLVEDNEDHAELIMEILEDATAPVDVRRCVDGEMALACLSRSRDDPSVHLPDLVLLDLDMPRMDGFQTLAALKADPRTRRIPVVILTTSRELAPGADPGRRPGRLTGTFLRKSEPTGRRGRPAWPSRKPFLNQGGPNLSARRRAGRWEQRCGV